MSTLNPASDTPGPRHERIPPGRTPALATGHANSHLAVAPVRMNVVIDPAILAATSPTPIAIVDHRKDSGISILP